MRNKLMAMLLDGGLASSIGAEEWRGLRRGKTPGKSRGVLR